MRGLARALKSTELSNLRRGGFRDYSPAPGRSLRACWLAFPTALQAQTPDLFPITMDFGGGGSWLTPNHLLPGATTTLGRFVVSNSGGSAAGPFSIGIYLSADNGIDPGTDTQLMSLAVAGLAANVPRVFANTVLTIPPGTPAGSYFVGVYVDVANVVAESNESNNSDTVMGALTVQRPMAVDLVPANGPTIVIGDGAFSPGGPLTAGMARRASFQIALFTIENRGTEASPRFRVEYLISGDTAPSDSDALVGSSDVSGIAAGGSVNLSPPSFRLDEDVPDGAYNLLIVVDADNHIVEDIGAREANNIAANRFDVVRGPGDDYKVWRVQLHLTTADLADARTDDTVFARLNATNRTFLDYARNDFERNSRFAYDLVLNDVNDLGDIPFVRIGKLGTNGLCLRAAALIVNMMEIAHKTFTDGCFSLDPPDTSTELTLFTYADLRRSGDWIDLSDTATTLVLLTQALAAGEAGLMLRREDLESIIEANVGHQISSALAPGLRWGFLHGRGVEVTQRDASTFSVDLDLAGTGTADSVEVDVNFDITLSCACGESLAVVSNVDVEIDSPILAEILTLGVAELVDRVGSSFATDALASNLSSLSSAFGPSSDFCPDIRITSAGNLVLTRPPTLAPDAAISTTLAPATARAGSSITITAQVANQGIAPASNVLLTSSLSRGVWNPTGGTELARETVSSIAVCSTESRTLRLTLPANLACSTKMRIVIPEVGSRGRRGFLGERYHIVTTASATDDTVTTNNTSWNVLRISASDLAVQELKTTAIRVSAGASLTIDRATIANRGLFASGNIRYEWLLSRLPQPDASAVQLRVIDIADPLGPGESRRLAGSLPIPPGTTFGTYYLVLRVTERDGRTECSSTNNTASQLIVVG